MPRLEAVLWAALAMACFLALGESWLWILFAATFYWNVLTSCLVPTLLLVLLSLVRNNPPVEQGCYQYAFTVSVWNMTLMVDRTKRTWAVLLLAVLTVVSPETFGIRGIVYGMVWRSLCYYRCSNNMTLGDWFILSSLAAMAATELAVLLLLPRRIFIGATMTPFFPPLFAYTALTGLVGCGLACASVNRVAVAPISRLLYLGGATLGFVEICFWLYPLDDTTATPSYLMCLWWLYSFLLEAEEHTDSMANLPRAAWLAYWGVVLLLTIPLAPATNVRSAVLARKWFHFVGVLLFCPTTYYAPQLQSLGYAVALALLAVLESVRRDFPVLNAFYITYLDTSKQESADSTIVSHLALIFGCAAPLWISQLIAADDRILSLWGVMILGVGDSMAAVVGTQWGRTQWSNTGRTVEGSIAMFVSLSVACSLVARNMSLWLPAVVFCTLLEAVTLQLDNLVLPLAGAAVLLITKHL